MSGIIILVLYRFVNCFDKKNPLFLKIFLLFLYAAPKYAFLLTNYVEIPLSFGNNQLPKF